MLIPLFVLSVGAIFAGFVFEPYFVGEGRAEFWKHAIFTAPANTVLAEHPAPLLAAEAPLIAAVIGLAVNLVCALILKDSHGHDHHGHAHGGHTHGHDNNMRAAFIQVAADAGVSVLAICGLLRRRACDRSSHGLPGASAWDSSLPG